jgi:hypothetical protein
MSRKRSAESSTEAVRNGDTHGATASHGQEGWSQLHLVCYQGRTATVKAMLQGVDQGPTPAAHLPHTCLHIYTPAHLHVYTCTHTCTLSHLHACTSLHLSG